MGEMGSLAGARITAVPSNWVAVLRCSPVLGAAVNPFLAVHGFFMGQVDAAMGAGHHF
jgi:hypothetical protein